MLTHQQHVIHKFRGTLLFASSLFRDTLLPASERPLLRIPGKLKKVVEDARNAMESRLKEEQKAVSMEYLEVLTRVLSIVCHCTSIYFFDHIDFFSSCLSISCTSYSCTILGYSFIHYILIDRYFFHVLFHHIVSLFQIHQFKRASKAQAFHMSDAEKKRRRRSKLVSS